MGIWGTGISSNDTFEDISFAFFELYNKGVEVSEITAQLIEENQELIKDGSEDRNNFWFAVALAQWECKCLDTDILEKVKNIVTSGDDLNLWEELNASPTDVKKRKKILDQFLEKLYTEKKSARKRKKKVYRNSIFEKGDCLVFKLISGNYGGAVVLASEKQTEYGMNLIAVTDIDSQAKPTVDDIKKAKVLIQKDEEWCGKYQDREWVSWAYAQFFRSAITEFEIVGRLGVTKNYTFDNDFRSFFKWDYIPELLNRNEAIIKERGIAKKTLTLRELL